MNTLQKNSLQILVEKPIQWDCPLRDYTSFGIGGPAEALVSVENNKELQKILHFFQDENIAWRIIGRGTNILVKDSGVAGAAVVLAGEFKKISVGEQENTVLLTAGAGHSLSKLSSICMDNGYSGMEFAIGIPGSVGGAIMMNAGAWGSAIADILYEINLQTAVEMKIYRKGDLHIGYRTLKVPGDKKFAITSAVFVLRREERENIRLKCQNYIERRKQTQPSGYGNAGSFFKNPPQESAGKLIENSGLKGASVGDAEISTKHANFLINRGNASADDILELMDLVVDTVYRKSGIHLEPEVQIW